MASRFQVKTLYAQQGPVDTHEGVDPLTGLPVFIYIFSGRASSGLRDLESENIPGVLEVEIDGATSRVIVAYSKDYKALEKPLAIDPNTLLLDSARALRDAAQAGIVHGDLRPKRFLASQDHVLLEGFGIPWQPQPGPYAAPEIATGASFAADVYAWASSVLALSDDLGEARAVVNACLADSPAERPSAAEIYNDLRELARSSAAAHAAVDTETGLDSPLAFDLGDFGDNDFERAKSSGGDFASGFEVSTQGASAEKYEPDLAVSGYESSDAPDYERLEPSRPPAAVSEKPDDYAFFDDPDASEVFGDAPTSRGFIDDDVDGDIYVSDGGQRAPVVPAANTPVSTAQEQRFVKNLPPGATYRAGDASSDQLRPAAFEEYTFDDGPGRRPRDLRRLILLLLLLAAAGVLAYLAWQGQGSRLTRLFTNTAPAAPTEALPATLYLVEVQIEPPNLPPVDLLVVSSPEGSASPPGTVLRERLSAGQHNVAFDRAGVWQLQIRFQNRASEPATLVLPDQRSVTLSLPPQASE